MDIPALKERQADQTEDCMAALLASSLLDSSNSTMSKPSLLKSEEQRIDAALEPVIGVLEIWKAIRN